MGEGESVEANRGGGKQTAFRKNYGCPDDDEV